MKIKVAELWNECLRIIQDIVDKPAYENWFKPIIPVSYEKDEFLLQLPSQFFFEYIEENYSQLIRATLSRILKKETDLLYRIMVVANDEGATILPPKDEKKPAKPAAKPTNSGTPFQKQALEDIDTQLNPKYSFNSYIEGNINKLPRSIGMSIANDPGKTFSPMFLHGPSGVGKTHLANAIGLKSKELHPNKRVLYVSANLFKLQYTDALVRFNSPNDFLNFYQSIDILIIDDIQDLINQTATQKTFFHIFNHLHQLGKQLIFCCDRHPSELEGMQENLITRFQWGLLYNMKKPDFELRKSILQHKIRKDGLTVPEEVIDYIATNVSDNVRNIEGVLISILAHATINNSDITLELAKNIIGVQVNNRPKEREAKTISLDMIRDLVCQEYKVKSKDLLSNGRARRIAEPRQIAMYLARECTNDALSSIGKTIGNRDHSTVVYACKTVKAQMDIDKKYRKKIEQLKEKITAL